MKSFVLILAALLSACGGGDYEPEDAMKTVGPPDCRSEPARCQ